MSRLVPLLREGADDLERTLLAAARHDGPPDRSARARTLAALKTASRTAAVVGAGTAGVKGLSLLKPAVIPWPAIGALGFALIVGGGALLVREHAPTRQLQSPPTSSASPSARAASSAPAASRPSKSPLSAPLPRPFPPISGGRESTRGAPFPPEIGGKGSGKGGQTASRTENPERSSSAVNEPDPTPSAPPASKQALSASPPAGTPGGSSSESATPPPVLPSSLRQEAALLESVRESLAASRFDRALASLDEYDARFASGALEEEGAVLRVEALLASGHRDEARRVTADFERRHPATSYAPRMRARVDPQ
jgi:hypothetical protein